MRFVTANRIILVYEDSTIRLGLICQQDIARTDVPVQEPFVDKVLMSYHAGC